MGQSIQVSKIIEHIYIHVPFCVQKCGYCSFYSIKYSNELATSYIATTKKEIGWYNDSYSLKPKTLYFGGGTPNLLSVHQIQELIEQFDLQYCQEITLEANPGILTESYLHALKNTPVNRISLGTQSFVQQELEWLKRIQSVSDNLQAIDFIRKDGYDNLSLDLIYGIPTQTKESLYYSLQQLIRMEPEHISAYCLTLDDEVPLASLRSMLPDDDNLADTYELIQRVLTSAGYIQYEISNFAKEEHFSLHNQCYWKDSNYLGIGPAASGYISPFRYDNPRNLTQYTEMVYNALIENNHYLISQKDHEKEYIMMAMRNITGVTFSHYKEVFNYDFRERFHTVIEKLLRWEMISIDKEHLWINPQHFFVSNAIISEFWELL